MKRKELSKPKVVAWNIKVDFMDKKGKYVEGRIITPLFIKAANEELLKQVTETLAKAVHEMEDVPYEEEKEVRMKGGNK